MKKILKPSSIKKVLFNKNRETIKGIFKDGELFELQ
jgi:hypothetical protein